MKNSVEFEDEDEPGSPTNFSFSAINNFTKTRSN